MTSPVAIESPGVAGRLDQLAASAREAAASYPPIDKALPEMAGALLTARASAYELAAKIVRGEASGEGTDS